MLVSQAIQKRGSKTMNQDTIEKIAFQLYMNSGRINGHDLDNWLEAEKIVWTEIEEKTQWVLELRT